MSRSNTNPRSWARRRYSSFFHGDSVVAGSRTASVHTRKASRSAQRSSRVQSEQHGSGLRSPTSTRSLIDPTSSPNSTARSISPDTFERFRRDSNRPALAYVRPSRTSGELDRAERHLARAIVRTRRRQAWPCSVKEKVKRRCLPNIRNPKIRRKIIGCLVSGGILAVMLTIYLALAISNSIESKAWNVVLIIFILLTTIVCCHYLIRLCILALRARRRGGTNRFSGQDDEGFAQPERPIRVILARDEELGLHGDSDEEESVNASITRPPPAYGLWRCSMRADPNLIHWQRTGQDEVQTETRELIFNGEPLIRPPSYISEEGSHAESENMGMRVPPLFHRANSS